jgi:uncharacterized paraquat-inducible protein A
MLEKINPFESQEKIQERYKICNACEHIKISIIGAKCGACGCPLKSKLALKISTCPKDKW